MVAVDATGIGIHGTSDSLQVNGADLVVDANARLTREGDERILDVTTTGSGIGPRGRAIEHSGDYTIRANPATACRSIAGSWSTEITGPRGTGERGNDVDVERCADTCPIGTITHRGLAGATMTVTFDGTATAQWSAFR